MSHNTPLHLAAASGLLECIEVSSKSSPSKILTFTAIFSCPHCKLLVAHDAPLFVKNIAGQMPCDVAWNAKEIIIAKQLESKMVLDVRLCVCVYLDKTDTLLLVVVVVYRVMSCTEKTISNHTEKEIRLADQLLKTPSHFQTLPIFS